MDAAARDLEAFAIDMAPLVSAFMADGELLQPHASGCCLRQSELHALRDAAAAAPVAPLDSSSSSSFSSVSPVQIVHVKRILGLLSDLLLRPCLTHLVWRHFRPLLVDLVARWLDVSEISLESVICPLHGHLGVQHAAFTRKPLSLLFKSVLEGSAKTIGAVEPPPLSKKAKKAMSKVSPKHDRHGGPVSSDEGGRTRYLVAEAVLAAFSFLVPNAPQVKSFALRMFRSPLFCSNGVIENLLRENVDDLRLGATLRNLYRLVFFFPSLSTSWNWGVLYQLFEGPRSNIIKAYAVFTISYVLEVSDAERESLYRKYIGGDDTDDYSRLIRAVEKALDDEQSLWLFANIPSAPATPLKKFEVTYACLSPNAVALADVLLPKVTHSVVLEKTKVEDSLVMTKSTFRNLRNIGLGVSLGTPILLEGPPGVGKTFLVEEAAKIVSDSPLLVAHIGDQTDSKILLGTYVSQAEPGQFKWVPGILTTAVMEGRWLLIEDIDLAPAEVVSVLLPLLEARHLFIAARGEKIQAKEGFQLFATRTVFNGRGEARSMQPSDLLSKSASLWSKVRVSPLPDEEVLEIIRARFPDLAGESQYVIKAFSAMQTHFQDTVGITRGLSIRDLFKWCHRVSRFGVALGPAAEIPLQRREDFFREGVDCFCLMIQKASLRRQACEFFGSVLDIPSNRIEFYLDHFLPSINVTKASVTVGRTALDVIKKGVTDKDNTFAMTRSSIRLMERLAICVNLNEPVLLVGETGTGKTTAIQHLANLSGSNLVVMNLSQQSDSSDLLGGFKPVDARIMTVPLADTFYALFERTFSSNGNAAFVEAVRGAVARQKWEVVRQGFGNALKMAEKVLGFSMDGEVVESLDQNRSRKRAKKLSEDPTLIDDWKSFGNSIASYTAQLEHAKSSFLFQFIEGSLVKAIVRGDWVLLDEVNLASSETLECLSSVLQSPTGSITLLERGDTHPVKRHPNFRIFGCMNPATDAGKRDLPPGILSRLSEIWVDAPDADRQDLLMIVRQHLHRYLPPPAQGGDVVCANVADFHLATKELMEAGKLVDGSNNRVHVNMRTLSRALAYTRTTAPTFGLQRALYEGTLMTFTTMLSGDSFTLVESLITQFILSGIKNVKSFTKSVPKRPGSAEHMAVDSEQETETSTHILFNAFWVTRGPLETLPCDHYVITPSVDRNLTALARAVTAQKFPILIQGPTSAGKTSMIEYLAKRTGHTFVRVNNHEHTDIQEYIGTYAPDSNGQLVFREGVLVEALRKGFWIVLDELNLAPSDVLEALNRLLDDNRELLIPETQEVVQPHKNFMLFATQNPPGLYGGRKQLSRAFRSRFLELHFDDIPEHELSVILEKRCHIAPSYATKIVNVYKGLRVARQRSRIFEGKNAFATLRDLFRWANRNAGSWEGLGEDGYMLLAERARRSDEKALVKEVLEVELKVKLEPDVFYDREWRRVMGKVEIEGSLEAKEALASIVWTKAMKRQLVLVDRSLTFKEPILLVGETGCGKTTICQVIASILGVDLHIVNAHANSETSDFLGSMRPVRNHQATVAEVYAGIRHMWAEAYKRTNEAGDLERSRAVVSGAHGELKGLLDGLRARLEGMPLLQDLRTQLAKLYSLEEQTKSLFEWRDGPLITALRKGDAFLLDELSLADDSVLERLNSVLEPERQIVLAERGRVDQPDSGASSSLTVEVEQITADEKFCFFATMNPGGDYGKKELSPALRNRFTEIWVPQISDRDDLLEIIGSKLPSATGDAARIPEMILEFLGWLGGELNKGVEAIISMRDILAWVSFIFRSTADQGHETPEMAITIEEAFVHGGCMVFADGIGVNPLFGITSTLTASKLRGEAIKKLYSLADIQISSMKDSFTFETRSNHFGSAPFFVRRGPHTPIIPPFSMKAPTTSRNVMKVLRALRVQKPILLEGSPGVGKTSLISSLSAVCGYRLCRINLSDQTDLMDLFGSDLPIEGGLGGEFAWRDGPFLHAMNQGDWVLLDELNLASQQVLEGLNACLDHRGEVYIPELDRTFLKHPNFRVFAAQNPQNEGGGRKGLPKSFVNRFTQVYVEGLSADDLSIIANALFPNIGVETVMKMIEFNQLIHEETTMKGMFGSNGSPWEFNLRDVLRWMELTENMPRITLKDSVDPAVYADILYTYRMRTSLDRMEIGKTFEKVFHHAIDVAGHSPSRSPFFITPEMYVIGSSPALRANRLHDHRVSEASPLFLKDSKYVFESLSVSVKMGWTALLVGPSGCGKTSLVRSFASLSGQHLVEFCMNPSIDASEIIGGFEQLDVSRLRHSIISTLRTSLQVLLRWWINCKSSMEAMDLSAQLDQLTSTSFDVAAADSICLKMKAIFESHGDDVREHFTSIGASTPAEILAKIEDYRRKSSASVQGRFEWIDGSLIRAMESGSWILIDNVNLCPASVLDRLNSLLEPNGFLAVSERGIIGDSVKILRPHPNFRMFLAMDPKFGELSRAMRNRSLEISMLGVESSANFDDFETDLALLNHVGIPGEAVTAEFLSFYSSLQRASGDQDASALTLSDPQAFRFFCRTVLEKVHRGQELRLAIKDSFENALKDEPVESSLWIDSCIEKCHIAAEKIAKVASTMLSHEEGLKFGLCLGSNIRNGDLTVEESDLADICLRARHLIENVSDKHALESVDSFFTLFPSVVDFRTVLEGVPSVSHLNLFLGSLRQFLLFRMPDKSNISTQVLRFLGALFGNLSAGEIFSIADAISSTSSVLKSEEVIQLLSTSIKLREKVSAMLQIDDSIPSLPIEHIIEANPKLYVKVKDDAAYRSLVHCRSLIFSWCKVYQKNSLLNATVEIDTVKGTLQVSKTLWKSLVTFSNDLLKLYLESILKFFKEWDFLLLFTCYREELLRILSSSPLDKVRCFQIVKGWIKLLSTTLSRSAQLPSLSRQIKTMIEALDSVQKHHGMFEGFLGSRLWKNGHRTCLRDESISIENRFLSLCQPAPGGSMKGSELILDPWFKMSASSKTAVIDGIASIHLIDRDPSETSVKLRQVLASAPEAIFQELQKNVAECQKVLESLIKTPGEFDKRIRFPLSLARDLSSRALKFGSCLLGDIRSIQLQQNLHRAIEVFILQGAKGDKVQTILKQHLIGLRKGGLQFSRRLVTDFEPLKRLQWALGGNSKDSLKSGHDFIMFASSCYIDSYYRWQKALWNNSFNEWATADQTFFGKDLLVGRVEPFIESLVLQNKISSSSKAIASLYDTEADVGPTILAESNLVPLYACGGRSEQLETLAEIYTQTKTEAFASMSYNLLSLFFNIRQASASFLKDFPANISQPLFENLDLIIETLTKDSENLNAESKDKLSRASEAIADSLKATRGSKFSRIYSRYAIPIFTTFQSLLRLEGDPFYHLSGRLWMLFSILFVRVYMPPTCYDPSIIARVKFDFLQEVFLDLQADILTKISQDTLGFSKEDPVVKGQIDTLESVQQKQRRSLARIRCRPKVSQINEIFTQLQYLHNNLLSDSSAEALWRELESGMYSSDKERFLQDTLSAFIGNIETKFPYYRDVTQPICQAIFHFKFGLHIAIRYKFKSEELNDMALRTCQVYSPFYRLPEPDFDVASFITKLETCIQVSRASIPSNQTAVTALRFALSNFHVSSFVAHPSIDKYRIFTSVLRHISDLWLKHQQDKSERETEAEAFYKYKAQEITIASEDELNEREVLSHFPDFAQEINGEEDTSNAKDSAPSISNHKYAIPDELAAEVWLCFEEIVRFWSASSSSKTHDLGVYKSLLAGPILLSFKSLSQLRTGTSLSLTGESQSLFLLLNPAVTSILKSQLFAGDPIPLNARLVTPGTFAILNDSLSNLRRPYDFYRDENIPEARLLAEVLDDFDLRLSRLLALWPEHSVLQDLSFVCNRIAGFPVSSPIMKFLTGAELILQKCNDWEAYASREYSLSESMKRLTDVIVRWRKLELSSWQKLLDVEDFKAETGSAKLWFHMFNVIAEWLHSYEQYDDASIDSTLKILDQFCLSSSVGEFRGRLAMLKSFHELIQMMLHEWNASPRKEAILKLTWNVWSYYHQFEDKVSEYIRSQRQPILKELNDYVKIATWKDINVFALQASAKKSHHTLTKFIKKYSEILKRPVKDIIGLAIEQKDTGSSHKTAGSTGTLQIIQEMDSIYARLKASSVEQSTDDIVSMGQRFKALPQLFLKMQSLIDQQGRVVKINIAAAGVEEMSASIIDRLQDFRQINTTLEGGSKKAKNQKNIRRKAFVDLLKYLQYLGLSPRCIQRFKFQREPTYTFAQGKVQIDQLFGFLPGVATESYIHPKIGDVFALGQRTHDYFYRNIALMSKVRDYSRPLSHDLKETEREKCVSYLENLVGLAFSHRQSLSATIAIGRPLFFIAQQMEALVKEQPSSEVQTFSGGAFASAFDVLRTAADGVLEVLLQVEALADILSVSDKSWIAELMPIQSSRSVFMSWLLSFNEISNIFLLKRDGENVHPIVTRSAITILVSGEDAICKLAVALKSIFANNSTLRGGFSGITGSFELMLENVRTAVETLRRVASPVLSSDLSSAFDEFIERVLVSFQDLIVSENGFSKNVDDSDEFGLDSGHLTHTHETLSKIFSSDNFKRLQNCAVSLSAAITESNAGFNALSSLITRFYPLYRQYLLMFQQRLLEFLIFHKSVTKLTYILGMAFSFMFDEGFCVPEVQENDDNAESGEGEMVTDGVGLGDGQGAKDVSDEIEDQDQIEELKNEKQDSEDKPQNNPKTKNEKDAVEMDYDIDGDLTDVSEPEDGEEEEQEEEGDEPDEKMGGLDQDLADVVDEQLWNGEEPKGPESEEKTELDAPMESNGDTETVAQSQPDKAESDSKEKNDSKDGAEEKETMDEMNEAENGEEETGPINEDLADKFEENHGIDAKDPNPVEQPTEEMDLPDDLNLDMENEGDDKKEEFDRGDGNDEEEGPDAKEESGKIEDSNETSAPDDEDTEGEIFETSELDKKEEEGGDEEEGEGPPDNVDDATVNAEADRNQEDGGENPVEEEKPDEEAITASSKDSKTSPDLFGVQQDGQDAVAEPTTETGGKSSDEANENTSEPRAQASQDGESRPDGSGEAETASRADQDPNPERSIGDSLKKWISRIKSIADNINTAAEQDADAEEKDTMDSSDPNADYEFVSEQQKANAQALASATMEQAREMESFGKMDETEEREDPDRMAVDDSEEKAEEKEAGKESSAFFSDIDKIKEMGGADDKEEVSEKGGQKGDDESGMELDKPEDGGREMMSMGQHEDEEEFEPMEVDGEEEVDPKSYEEHRKDLELALQEWRSSGQNAQQAQELWRQYTSITSDLAFALCESLRLILEPTLATKLKGDYRTGKRLNMRKVIPYIASQFKKDKIWLRRTKPFKRSYQIMLAIDDSRSMAESKSIELAYESLAIISKAMAQLEAGEIGVVSFGEIVRLLHPFENVFSDDAGANVIKSFTFAQERTDVKRMMSTTAEMLNHARAFSESGGGGRQGDLWQLQIIVSDGICEEHSEIKALVRRAAQSKIMVVFIILDRRGERDAIMKITNVTYNKDPKTGRMALKMSRYMDSFPFDYYLVLKDTSELPEVLADTLRQYFMFINS
ncbi:hypothetical protein HDU67_009223 [Dinochytrium kinnereticum]|nr:hypothetical protein HDU67_009223 [Dinochytrium kinnereticum]